MFKTILKSASTLAAKASQIVDTCNEAMHAVSACVELAREAESNRYSAADAFRDGILNKENGRLVDERDQLRVELKSTAQERDALSHKLDWLMRWREGQCPFPSRTKVFRWHADTEAQLHYTEEWPGRPWRPANLDLYEEFRDA